MGRSIITAAAGFVVAGMSVAQTPIVPPPTVLGPPIAIPQTTLAAPVTGPHVPAGAPLASTIVPPPIVPQAVLPPPGPAQLPPTAPDAFGVGLPPGTLVSPVYVRPPEPVAGAPEEVPPGPRFWGSFEYLLWRAKGGILPPLVSALSDSTDPRDSITLSDNMINGDIQQGFRITGGMWLDKPRGTGVAVSYMTFLESGDSNSYSSEPGIVLGRPFIDATRGLPALLQLSTPSGTTQGFATVRTAFDAEGIEANLFRRGPAMIGEEMHWIVGFRHLGLEESLTVEALSQAGGLRAAAWDRFATRNNFYGAQVGGRWNFTRNSFTVDLTAKVGVGGMGQEAVIQGGSSVVMPSGARVDRPGGLLALSSNMGDYDRTKMVFLQDYSISVGYCVASNVTLRIGYDFLWLSNVLRPGEQIDQGINPTLLPFSARSPAGVARPEFRYNGETFYMHGITLGVAVQF